MIALIQRVKQAKVDVAGHTVGEIGQGILVLLGVERDDIKLSRDGMREQGYVYDQINAKLLFNDGVAKVDYFLVESEESDIELTGSVDLIKRDYNLAANVQPSITNTIPLATYLAGGGLAGLGVWAADKMLFGGKVMGELLDNVVEITFMISGPWSEPIIEKLDGVKVL